MLWVELNEQIKSGWKAKRWMVAFPYLTFRITPSPIFLRSLFAYIMRAFSASSSFLTTLTKLSADDSCIRIESTARLSLAFEVYNTPRHDRSEEHTSELQSLRHLVCRLL